MISDVDQLTRVMLESKIQCTIDNRVIIILIKSSIDLSLLVAREKL